MMNTVGIFAPVALIVAVFLVNLDKCAAFSPPSLSFLGGLKSVLDGALSTQSGPTAAAQQQKQEREELKAVLLSQCRGGGTAAAKRQEREDIESAIERLVPLCPTENTASSSLLQNKWILEWTTEKEINFFSDWNISGEIFQTIDGDKLGNDIEFKRGGGLFVSGKLCPDETNGLRTNFKFTSAILDLGSWGQFNFPPVGEGWFDTVYLDEDLRVDTNSRNDILICTPGQQ